MKNSFQLILEQRSLVFSQQIEFAPKLQSVKLLGVFPIVQVVLFVQTLLCFIFFPRCLIIAHPPTRNLY